LRATSDATSGQTLAIVIGDGNDTPVASSSGVHLDPADVQPIIRDALTGAISTGVSKGGLVLAASPLHGYGAAKAVLVGAAAVAQGPGLDDLLWPLLLAFGLGLTLVVISGILLSNYLSRPIAEIEEGLLLIINGQRDLRFDLEHDELGGLTSRMNALLNSLLGVDEGETPADRPPAESSD
jgi:methyl-accepting chemotaxis protein